MQIYVRLVNEDVDVWAPVEARQLYDDAPGDTVRCESMDSDSGSIMVAVAPA